MAGITAAEFEEVYGTLTRAEYPEYTRERALSKVLSRRDPAVIVPDGVLRVWLKKYKSPDSVTVPSIAVLQEEYGELVKELAHRYCTSYQLCKALRTTQIPSILISDCMAKEWFKKYGNVLQNQRFKKYGKVLKDQRMLAPNGTLVPIVKGVRTYFGIVY